MLAAALLLIITRERLSRESSAYVMWAGVLLQAYLLTEHGHVSVQLTMEKFVICKYFNNSTIYSNSVWSFAA